MIRTKRVYDPPRRGDGVRVLVDRLWPRGLSKDKAKVEIWLKDVAPSDRLRKWFRHDSATWKAFRQKYRVELQEKSESLQTLTRLELERGIVTLVYAASDADHNNAIVLAEWLKTGVNQSSSTSTALK